MFLSTPQSEQLLQWQATTAVHMTGLLARRTP
jgi:hypothetical protein